MRYSNKAGKVTKVSNPPSAPIHPQCPSTSALDVRRWWWRGGMARSGCPCRGLVWLVLALGHVLY